MPEPLDRVFDLLDRWRHFPAYQLERRADIFFAPYLAGVIGEVAGVEMDDRIIPEFPLRLGTLFDDGSNQSAKVDYLVLARDRSRAFLVELKTDMASRRDRQDELMKRACEVGMRGLLEGVVQIAPKSAEMEKYGHLLFELQALGLLDVPASIRTSLYPRRERGVTAQLRQVRAIIGHGQVPLSVLYVQPLDGGSDEVISFARFAEHVERFSDPISGRFRQSLLRWTELAGAVAPSR
jgi:hypothetical protein